MNETIMVVGGLVVLAAICLWLVYFRKKRTPSIETRVLVKITDKRTAPSGLGIWVEDGVKVNNTQIALIEGGLLECFVKAACKGYGNAMALSDYIVAIVKGEPSSDGTPCYRVPAGPYAGSEYDKGGYILVAGQMLAIGEPFGNIIVIPEHFPGQEAHLSLVAEFEAEHVVLAFNDVDEFERTKIHGSGTGHPIIPDCSASRPVLRQPPKGFRCGPTQV